MDKNGKPCDYSVFCLSFGVSPQCGRGNGAGGDFLYHKHYSCFVHISCVFAAYNRRNRRYKALRPPVLGKCLYESGVISKKRGEYLCCLCSGASVPFILSFAGAQIMGDIKYGLKLLLLLAFSVLVIALGFRPFLLKNEQKQKISAFNYIRKTDFTAAVSESAYLLVSVCGFIVCFYVLGITVSGVFPKDSLYSLIVRGLFEFSGGIAQSASFPLPMRETLCGLFLGFGSLSGMFQTVSVINKSLSPKPFIISRILTGVLMVVLTLLT